jgi:hypothetical protein
MADIPNASLKERFQKLFGRRFLILYSVLAICFMDAYKHGINWPNAAVMGLVIGVGVLGMHVRDIVAISKGKVPFLKGDE